MAQLVDPSKAQYARRPSAAVLDDDAFLERLLRTARTDPLPSDEADEPLLRRASHHAERCPELRRMKRVAPPERRMEWIRQRNEVARVHLRLALYGARSCAAGCHSFQLVDLFQQGVLGLIRAAELYDPACGPFDAYARQWIYSLIVRAIRRQDHFVRKPRDSWRGRDHRDPAWRRPRSLESMTPEAVERAARASSPPSSPPLPAPLSRPPLPDEIADARERRLRVLRAVRSLRRRERFVIVHRYALLPGVAETTLQELANRLSVSRERVRQIQWRAEERLRALLQRRSSPFRVDVG